MCGTIICVLTIFVGLVWLVYTGVWHLVEPLGWDKGWAGVITLFISAFVISIGCGYADWRDSRS